MPAVLQASMRSVPAGAVSCLPSTENFTSAILMSCSDQLFHRDDRCPGLIAGDIVFKLFAEFFDKAERRHCRCVAERAERSAHHVFGKVLNVVDVLLAATAVVHAGEG